MSVIIHSIIDNDVYKFTMQNAVTKLFPTALARYEFINRGKHEFPKGFDLQLKQEIKSLEKLSLNKDERKFLEKNCNYLDSEYLDYLQDYRFNANEVSIIQNGTDLEVKIEGPWHRTILWEVPIMSIICELFYKLNNLKAEPESTIISKTLDKLSLYKNLNVAVAEFGTRRRHSYKTQNLVVKTLVENGGETIIGTSNVHLAMVYQTKPIGTHAHEWFMFHGAKFGYENANKIALENWIRVYGKQLNIALTDTFTTDDFLKDFDLNLAKQFAGVRHDSGDPLEFAEKFCKKYQSLGIDPRTKSIIFSDGLNNEKVSKITDYCNGKIGFSFGIGTYLTNDVGLTPMNIVLKMIETNIDGENWSGVVKLSDEPLKNTGSNQNIQIAKNAIANK